MMMYIAPLMPRMVSGDDRRRHEIWAQAKVLAQGREEINAARADGLADAIWSGVGINGIIMKNKQTLEE